MEAFPGLRPGNASRGTGLLIDYSKKDSAEIYRQK
jgi:hypothetical protein